MPVCRFAGLPKLSTLKVLPYGKVKLVDENLLEGIQIVLLIEDEHCLLIVYGVNRPKTQWTVAVGNQNGITGDASRALIAVRERLDIRQEYKCEKRLFKNVLFIVDQVACIMYGLTNLEFIIQGMIIGARDAHTSMTDPSVD
jgi:hypothetical protein